MVVKSKGIPPKILEKISFRLGCPPAQDAIVTTRIIIIFFSARGSQVLNRHYATIEPWERGQPKF